MSKCTWRTPAKPALGRKKCRDQTDRVGEEAVEGTGKAKLGKQVEMFAEPGRQGQDFGLPCIKREEQTLHGRVAETGLYTP